MPAQSTSTVSAFIVGTPTYAHLSRSFNRPTIRLRLYNENSCHDDLTRLVFCNTYYYYCSHRVSCVGLGWTGVRPSQSGTPLIQATVASLTYPMHTAPIHKRFILRRSQCVAMIRLISLDSGTRPCLLVLVLTAHNRGGRSCQQSGRSLYHKTPNSD